MNLKSIKEVKRQRFKEATGETLRDVILSRIKDLEADYRVATFPKQKDSILKALRMNSCLIHGPDFIYRWSE